MLDQEDDLRRFERELDIEDLELKMYREDSDVEAEVAVWEVDVYYDDQDIPVEQEDSVNAFFDGYDNPLSADHEESHSTLEPNASPGDDQTYLLAVRMRISQARQSLNLTQEAAADLAHLPVRTYQGLESLSEHRDFNPTLKTLRAVARAVGQTVPDLTREPTQAEIEEIKNQQAARGVPRRVRRA
jgi:DNA-binding XRE family transcriptional regulator